MDILSNALSLFAFWNTEKNKSDIKPQPSILISESGGSGSIEEKMQALYRLCDRIILNNPIEWMTGIAYITITKNDQKFVVFEGYDGGGEWAEGYVRRRGASIAKSSYEDLLKFISENKEGLMSNSWLDFNPLVAAIKEIEKRSDLNRRRDLILNQK